MSTQVRLFQADMSIHSMPGTLVTEERASESLRVSSPGSVSEQQSLDLRSYYLCSSLYLHCLFLDPHIKYLEVRPQFPKLCPALLLEERGVGERQMGAHCSSYTVV